MHPETFRRALAATARVACCSALLGCTPKPPPPTVTPPAVEKKDDLSVCQAHTRAVFTNKTETPSERTKACCQQLATSFGSNLNQADEWAEHGGCCQLIGWRGYVACTPWGPPCPPALETV